MRSKKILPVKQRDEENYDHWVSIENNTIINSRQPKSKRLQLYLHYKVYTKAIRALEAAENEIECLQSQIRDLKIINAIS